MPRNKRTRQERVDDAVLADGETWEVDFLLARRTGSATGKQYLVRWKGFTDKHDTWYACLSPSSCLSHVHIYRQTEADLAGAKELIVDFDKRKDEEQESDRAAAKAKNAELVAKKREDATVRHPCARALPCTCSCVAMPPHLLASLAHPLSSLSWSLHHLLCAGTPCRHDESDRGWQGAARRERAQEEAHERVTLVAILCEESTRQGGPRCSPSCLSWLCRFVGACAGGYYTL